MDIELIVYWSNDKPSLIEGSIIEVREIRSYAAWNNAKKAYELIDPTTRHPNLVRLFVVGVPVDTLVSDEPFVALKPLLERMNEETGQRTWIAKRNLLHPVQEASPLLLDGYLTITWDRLKEIVGDITDAPLEDWMLTSEQYWIDLING